MATSLSKLPPATPSKLRGKLLGVYERHYAWNTEDCSEKPGGKYGYKRRKDVLRAVLTLATLLSVICLPSYLYSLHHLPPLKEQPHQEKAIPPPARIRRIVSTATADLPSFRQT